ncbi:centrosomal of 104 kDa [Chlorella sorokiniana]|uniref:Centrosomal of 104 kDa n=1 Tax=Chlorella sorokiniana TaxID=3076 RepID=A0A2P6TVF2_CHLSO|nr:centrosomal of 104 kDa [Chlorella sorokiniana]|eukprot:PRW58028.1 centrosomal of 104 kDa [Chlorella sorokiniana]
MPVKLGFSIASCSGEDPEFPATELLLHSADSKGWCSPRFSQYPQEITLALEAPARLHTLQLLSHEFKIAARVELLVDEAGAAADTGKPPVFKRLGFLNFDPNERSQFTARELKSVSLTGTITRYVRLVFHKCHANPANLYSQVSLVALSLTGDLLVPSPLAPITNTAPFGMPGGAPPASPPPMAYMQPPQLQQQFGAMSLGPPQQQAAPHAPSTAEAAAALAAELGVDTVTAQRIYELQQQKQQAVDREDYDEAKRLKGAVDALRAAGGAIAELEAQKRAAVEVEDYDLAKSLKLQIDRMRSAAYSNAMSHSGAEAAFSPAASRRASAVGGPAGPAAAAARPSYDGSSGPPAASPSAADWNTYDERPAQAKGAYNFQNADESSTPVNARRTSATGPAARPPPANDAGPPPPGFPTDLAAPEPLSAADAKDAGPLIDLAGEYLARCLHSRTWQLREAALAALARGLAAGRVQGVAAGSADAVKTLARLLQRTCRDKVAAVFGASLTTLRALVTAAAAGGVAPRDLQSALGDLLPLLVEKAADLNQRTREQATETLVALAGVPEAGLRTATAPFLRPLKPGAAPKVVLGRLQLVAALLPVVGMAGRGGEGFQLESLMDFANPALSHSSADVRGAAVALVVQVAQVAGPSVQRLLPADLNSKVREQIEQGMLNPAAMGGAAAAKPPSLPRTGSGPAARAQQPPAAAPPAAAAPQQAQQVQQQAQQAPAAAAAAQPAPLPVPDENADPALYEAEVKAREARLGPSHPDVAEAICNLAILHNQRGDTAAALPLYERALAIWEAAGGPHSPDVAHTLTDIAVIHLEAGRDDLGRPLLQRALAIQEAHLGPDHPDVLAIRDVLEEEA